MHIHRNGFNGNRGCCVRCVSLALWIRRGSVRVIDWKREAVRGAEEGGKRRRREKGWRWVSTLFLMLCEICLRRAAGVCLGSSKFVSRGCGKEGWFVSFQSFCSGECNPVRAPTRRRQKNKEVMETEEGVGSYSHFPEACSRIGPTHPARWLHLMGQDNDWTPPRLI